MTINWFPGHMNRARRELAEAIARIDVVIELLDARLPRSSRNPMLAELCGERPRLVLLGKRDLADESVTRRWLEALAGAGESVLALCSSDVRAVRGLPARLRALAPTRGGPGRTLRCMVVGIPNVGKSTLINTLLGRRSAKVGDQPAITRGQQSFQLDRDIRIADTPGVLWPKLSDQTGALRLAAAHAIRDVAYDVMEVAAFAARFLAARYPALLHERYGIEPGDLEPHAIVEAIGRRRGFLQRGGVVDVERAAETLLRELRSGKIGRVSFERPDDFPTSTD